MIYAGMPGDLVAAYAPVFLLSPSPSTWPSA